MSTSSSVGKLPKASNGGLDAWAYDAGDAKSIAAARIAAGSNVAISVVAALLIQFAGLLVLKNAAVACSICSRVAPVESQ